MIELSPYLLAALTGWLVAQLLKFLLVAIKSKSFRDVSWLYQSGNMPSTHTATMVALVTVIGVMQGVESPLFALALTTMLIIAYDAMQVRRASGEQGLALRNLLKKAKIDTLPHHALGHKPLEVVVGGMIGVATGLIVAFFMT